MKKILFQLITLFIATFSFGQSCDLFFSEYLEGASNNKAIEIYNPLNVSVNLNNYKVYRYNNGSPIPTDSLQLIGSLAPGSVYVAGNPSAIAAILNVADTLHTITFFNGDDAMELIQG
jgi:predicted extracellular nuclease